MRLKNTQKEKAKCFLIVMKHQYYLLSHFLLVKDESRQRENNCHLRPNMKGSKALNCRRGKQVTHLTVAGKDAIVLTENDDTGKKVKVNVFIYLFI